MQYLRDQGHGEATTKKWGEHLHFVHDNVLPDVLNTNCIDDPVNLSRVITYLPFLLLLIVIIIRIVAIILFFAIVIIIIMETYCLSSLAEQNMATLLVMYGG